MANEAEPKKETQGNEAKPTKEPPAKGFWITGLPIVLSIFAALFSVWTFLDSQEFQRKTSSVAAMKDHVNLSMDHIDDTVSPWERTNVAATRAAISDKKYKDLSPEEKRYVWYASHALFTAETIYNWQVGDDVLWEKVNDVFGKKVKEEWKNDP